MLIFGGFAHLASAKEDFLEPDQAFQFSARALDDKTIEARFSIADGYYLYRERFKFVADALAVGQVVELGEPVYPKGKIKFDKTFNKEVEYYRGEVVVRIPVVHDTLASSEQRSGPGARSPTRIPAPASHSPPLTLRATYQGCADAGLCYAPIESKATIDFSLRKAGAAAGSIRGSSAEGDENSRLAATLRGGNLVAIAAVFVGLGLLLSLTPCVLPMLPILSAIIVGQGGRSGGEGGREGGQLADKSAGADSPAARTRGFTLALVYSLGMALVYTAMGVAAGLAGEGLAAALQNAWTLGAFSMLLVLLSLSMFGFYELQIPASWQTRLSAWSGASLGEAGAGSSIGKFAGVFLMGAVSALIVGPCVAAPLAGTLIYISRTRDVLIGGLALFALATGMSVPLLLLGASAGRLLPKAGPWMESVKRVFGILLIAVAIWMVAPVLPVRAQMLAWAALLVVGAACLRLFEKLPSRRDTTTWTWLGKAVGVLLVLGALAQIVGLATGGNDVLQPLAHLNADGRKPAAPQIAFERVRTSAELDRRLATAGKPVMLDFYADWCVSCKEMERFTYTDPRVAAKMGEYLLLQADVTANTDDDKALLKRFELFGPPGILFFERERKSIPGARVIGFQNAEQFLESMKRVEL